MEAATIEKKKKWTDEKAI